MLTFNTSLQCLLRTWCIGAAMTTKGMQHIGLVYALDPGLKQLYEEGESLQNARQRYLCHVNTHPYMAPLLVGFILNFEQNIRSKDMGQNHMANLVGTTGTTLSAIGDSFFSGSLVVFWALLSVLCILHSHPMWAILFTACLIVLLIAFRVYTFFLGLRLGLMALNHVRQWNLIALGERVKICNALLTVAVLWTVSFASGPAFLWGNIFWGVLCLVCGAMLISKAHISRILLLFFIIGVLYIHSYYPSL